VVVWNCSISGGGIIGGILLNRVGAESFPWALLPLLLIAFAIAASTKRSQGFARASPGTW
jgi:predicted MFS family arabinose efflux permease